MMRMEKLYEFLFWDIIQHYNLLRYIIWQKTLKMGCCSSSNRNFSMDSLGHQRKQPDTTKNTSWFNHEQFSYATSQMCGWRRHMEDALIAKCPTHDGSEVSLFAIFDGHGGPQISKYLSQNLEKWLFGCTYFKQGNYEEAFKTNFLKIDEYLRSQKGLEEIQNIQLRLSKGQRGAGISVGGSTAVIVLLTPKEIHIAHTGDSKAVLVKGKDVIYETIDHKPYLPLELERINSNGGFVERERLFGDLSVSRGFGDFHYKDNANPYKQFVSPIPQVTSFRREQVQLIMLGCDGIWEDKETSKIIEDVGQKITSIEGNKLMTMGEKLALTLERYMNENVAQNPRSFNGTDNMSAILIKFNSQ